MFFSNVDSAKAIYDAANKDVDDNAYLAAMGDYKSFNEKYGDYSSISGIESFAYFASSLNNGEPTNPVYGTITNSAK
jgi:hypothetical protein